MTISRLRSGLPMCLTITRRTSPDAAKRSAKVLAAALDSVEPSGKSPGCGPESVAGKNAFFLELSITYNIPTVNRCCAYYLCEPIGQIAISRVGFQLLSAHPLEQFI
ncbi:MAG: hypothetical protein WA715_28250 [Candidatus Acidiferrum sp.]